MATNQTEHYKLNQWELSDSVVMADFNADNAKIEQALLDAKTKFQSGSYVGTGTYGAETPNSLVFDFEPQLVILVQESKLDTTCAPTVCIRGVSQMITAYDSASFTEFRPVEFHMIWEANIFRWYTGNAASQFNTKDMTYHYIAIG